MSMDSLIGEQCFRESRSKCDASNEMLPLFIVAHHNISHVFTFCFARRLIGTGYDQLRSIYIYIYRPYIY